MAQLISTFTFKTITVHTHHHHPKPILKHHYSLSMIICLAMAIFAGCCFDQSVAEKGIRRPHLNEQVLSGSMSSNELIGQPTPKSTILLQRRQHDETDWDKLHQTPKPPVITSCTVNRTYSEMFCQFGDSPASQKIAKEFKHILDTFDEQNDNIIFAEFKHMRINNQTAGTISRVIKQFFQKKFCLVVASVMQTMKMEIDEVKKVAAINSHIHRLLTSLEHTSKFLDSQLSKMIRNLVQNLYKVGEKALNDLKGLEKAVHNEHRTNDNELYYIRTHIVTSLVNLFFNESVIRQTSGDIPIDNSQLDLCLNGEFDLDIEANPKLEVSCAFRFLFESSVQFSNIITDNFEKDEDFKQRNYLKDQSNGASRGCSYYRDDHEKSLIHQAACRILDDINHDRTGCGKDSENKLNSGCLLSLIRNKFNHNVRYLNKVEMLTNQRGVEGTIIALKSYCLYHNESTFIIFSLIDVRSYIANTSLFNTGPSHSFKSSRSTLKPIRTAKPKTTNVVRPKMLPNDEQLPIVHTHAALESESTRSCTKLPPSAHKYSREAMRKQYIIQSIIAYFLRSVEKRLKCSIKPI